MCFLCCLVKICTRKLALFQDPNVNGVQLIKYFWPQFKCPICQPWWRWLQIFNHFIVAENHYPFMVFFSSVLSQKKIEIIQARRSFGLSCLGSGSNPFFCLTRWETLKRLALEGSVNCVAYSSVTSNNADATETVGVETSLNSLMFSETFLAPALLKQISWLWFPWIEINCSPLVVAEVRQLSVWYWAQFPAVVN